MLQHLRTTVTNALVRFSAPLVAAAFLVITSLRARYSTRGPSAEFWERLRRRYLPTLDSLARSLDLGYAAYELDPREYAGTLEADPEAAERLLYRNGFRRNPFAAFKTLPDGRREYGSWSFRASLLARRQVHVMLFERRDGGTDVYAHAEYSAINPFVAFRHYEGYGYDPTRGQARVHDLLPADAWSTTVAANEFRGGGTAPPADGSTAAADDAEAGTDSPDDAD